MPERPEAGRAGGRPGVGFAEGAPEPAGGGEVSSADDWRVLSSLGAGAQPLIAVVAANDNRSKERLLHPFDRIIISIPLFEPRLRASTSKLVCLR